MYSMLKTRLGAPGLIAIIALVFAVGGGAAVAASGLTKAEKKQVRNIAKNESKKWSKKFSKRFAKRGPKGATGATGPVGPVGPIGPIGPAGSNGNPGAPGKSATTGEIEPGVDCEEGGAYVEVEGSGDKEVICNGVEGSPWAAGGVLPSEETLTGTYGGFFVNGDQGTMPISFALPVEPEPEATYVEGTEVEGKCPGVIGGVPTAEPGHLCLYKALKTSGTVLGFLKPTGNGLSEGVAPSGTAFSILCASASCTLTGTWAVTAE